MMNAFRILKRWRISQKDFRWDSGHVLGPGEEKEKWYGTHNYKPEGQWNTTADVMVANFKDSGHPVFGASSAMERGFLEKERLTMRDSLQCWTFERGAFFSHSSLCESAQFLRSNRGLVWWIDSANAWSINSKHGEIRWRRCDEQLCRKLELEEVDIRWYKHLGRMFKQRGIRLRIHQERL